MRVFARSMVLALILMALCARLGAQTSVPPVNLFSLEGNSGAPPLHVFRVNPLTGSLTEVPNSPFATGLNSNWLVVDPTGRFVYVSNSNSNDITAYSVDATTGTLAWMPGSPFTTGVNPGVMAIDSTGRFLYVSTFDSTSNQNNIYAFSIDPVTGVLRAVAGSPFAQANVIGSITFDPKANFVFLAQAQQNPLATLIDSVDFTTGAPTALGSVFIPQIPVQLTAMEPSGRFLYTADVRSNPSEVGAFGFDPGQGSLTNIQGSPFVAAPIIGAFDFAFDSLGKFLYLVSSNYQYQANNLPSQYNGSISAFSIDSQTGGLTQIGSPVAAGINPLSIVVDPSSHFAYASSTTYTAPATTGHATLLSYTIDASSGGLTPFSSAPWMDTQVSNGSRLAISYGPIAGTSNPMPKLNSLSPSSIPAGNAGFQVQVIGDNFVSGATVYFGRKARNTTFGSATQLTADILSTDVANGGSGIVFVFNPLPGGGASNSLPFAVVNPAPITSSIVPSSVVAGAAGFTLVVNGSNFVTGSIVNFNGAARPTTFVSSTKLTTAISAIDIAKQDTPIITVTNPANGIAGGGGTSSPVTLTILPGSIQPTVATLVPGSATAGGAAFTLTVIGSGFTPSFVVSFNLNIEPTTFISSTQLQAAIPASAIALAGNPVVFVSNSAGGVSLLANFVVNNPPPGGGTVSPPSLPAGAAALTLNVTGMNFTRASTVLVNGNSRITTYISSILLQAALLPSDLSQGGTLSITVNNPPPGGGTTAAFSFVVADYSVSAPATPTSVTAGQSAVFVLTVAPTNVTFPNPVSFTASGLPTGAVATFSRAAITVGSTPANVTLSITTTARSFAPPANYPRGPVREWPSLYLIIGIFGGILGAIGLAVRIPGVPVRRLAPQLLLLLLLISATGLVACGVAGGGASPTPPSNSPTGTPAGTYPILVSATSGGATRTTTVTLTVM